ncbi:hypothetical protein D3C78_622750 [compost metagenome]
MGIIIIRGNRKEPSKIRLMFRSFKIMKYPLVDRVLHIRKFNLPKQFNNNLCVIWRGMRIPVVRVNRLTESPIIIFIIG